MLDGRDFVVLSDDWNGFPTSTIHLFRHILPGNRVFWLNMIGRMPQPTLSDAKRVMRVSGSWFLGDRTRRRHRHPTRPNRARTRPRSPTLPHR